MQSSKDDNIIDLKYRQLSFIPKSCPKVFFLNLCVPKGRCENNSKHETIWSIESFTDSVGRSDQLPHNMGPSNVTWDSGPACTQSKGRTFITMQYPVMAWKSSEFSAWILVVGFSDPFGMRVHQNRQLPRVRCYQQAHYQTPQKSSHIYKSLVIHLSKFLVWGERIHMLTM